MKNDATEMVVGIGEVLWDLLPEGKQIGGAPANFAYHVSQLGLHSCVVSAVGHDALGQEVIETFRQKGLTHAMSQIDYPTGTVEVKLGGEGIPEYVIHEQVAWDHIPFTPELEALAKRTKAICFGTLAQRHQVSRETIHRFLKEMPQDQEPLIIFDINLRQHFYSKEIIHHSLDLCNILKINDEELEVVADIVGISHMDLEAKCHHLLKEYQLKMLALTCGTCGSYLFTPSETSFQETPKVTVADTVGAGDSFTATLIASLLKGKSVSEAHALAAHVSAFVCTQKGAMPLLPKEFLK